MKSWYRKKASLHKKFWSIYREVLPVMWPNFTIAKYNLQISNIHHHIKFRRSIINRCSIKTLLLKILQYSWENTCVGLPFLMKMQAFSPVNFEKRLQHKCFPVNIVKFLRTPYFIEHFWCLLLLAAWIESRYDTVLSLAMADFPFHATCKSWGLKKLVNLSSILWMQHEL